MELLLACTITGAFQKKLQTYKHDALQYNGLFIRALISTIFPGLSFSQSFNRVHMICSLISALNPYMKNQLLVNVTSQMQQ